jgi:hypothetical protein
MTQTRMKYTDIRAAVAIDPDGNYRVLGCSKENEQNTIVDILKTGSTGDDAIYWITARLPLPQEFKAIVEEPVEESIEEPLQEVDITV